MSVGFTYPASHAVVRPPLFSVCADLVVILLLGGGGSGVAPQAERPLHEAQVNLSHDSSDPHERWYTMNLVTPVLIGDPVLVTRCHVQQDAYPRF